MTRGGVLGLCAALVACGVVGLGVQALRSRPAQMDGVTAALATDQVVERVWMVWSAPEGQGASGAVPEEVSLGSVRKWTTAALILTLVDDGVLDLDEPVGRWLPAWAGRPGVTLRRLLSHTSGLPMRPPSGTCAGLGTLEACVDRCAEGKPWFEPGERFGYSSLAFHVAARVAEAATSTPYETLFEERLARPIGLKDWRFEAAGEGLPDMEGSLWMPPVDVVRFVRAMHEGTVLSEASRREMGDGQTGGVPKVGTIPRGDWWLPGDDPHGLGMWRAQSDGPSARFWFSEGKQRVVAWVDRVQDRVVVSGVVYDGAVPVSERVAPHDVIHAVCVAYEHSDEPEVACLPFRGTEEQLRVYRSCRRGNGPHRTCMAGAQRALR